MSGVPLRPPPPQVDYRTVSPEGSARRRLRHLAAGAAGLVVAAATLAACAGPGSASGGSTTTSPPPPSTSASTSSTTSQPSTTSTSPPPAAYHVGITTFHWVDSSRGTINPADPSGPELPGRVLTTQVRYPTLGGRSSAETVRARPARVDGPFPVVLFAHGFGVDPAYYAPLLDCWVREGFVVVSPIFPDESTALVNKVGGISSKEGRNAEVDMVNEPGDIAFVLHQFDLAVGHGGGLLYGIAKTSDVALAGQSDGADVVAALAYGSGYAQQRAALPYPPKAVAILSGEPMGSFDGEPNQYSASSSSPAVLQVQSNADTCNGARQAAYLYSQLTGASSRLFMTLYGVSHLPPYTGGTDSGVVERVTTQWLRLELAWRDGGLSIQSIEHDGSVAGTSSVAPAPGNFEDAPPEGSCSMSLPTTTLPAQ